MNISITLELQSKLTLDQCVSLHRKAREAGYSDTDDYVTQLVANDIEDKPVTTPKTRASRKGVKA